MKDVIQTTFFVVFLLLMLIGFVIALVSIPVGISDYYVVQVFNQVHGTEYTFGQWFWAGTMIKDYHLGTVENKNYKIDLNMNGGEIKLNGNN